MELTGKCKEKFFEWYENREGKTLTPKELELMSESVIQNALIIEFFDSVGVYINVIASIAVGYESADFFYFTINNEDNRFKLKSRQEATIQAIKKANDLYNARTN